MRKFRKKSLKDLGKRLKKLRTSKGVSLNIFAFENDMTVSTVSRIENGNVNPKYSTLMAYCIAFNVTPEELLKGLKLFDEFNN